MNIITLIGVVYISVVMVAYIIGTTLMHKYDEEDIFFTCLFWPLILIYYLIEFIRGKK